MVLLLRRDKRIALGALVIEPTPSPVTPARNGDTDSTGPYAFPSSPDPTQPFSLERVNEAMRASETMRALEALRAVEARQASVQAAGFSPTTVRSIHMRVCPLCLLYEVTGSSPRAHVVPSDVRAIEVGRAPNNHIHAPQPSVSLKHFRLLIQPLGTAGRWAGYTVEVEDCESKNGTYVNGSCLAPGENVTLKDGDIIEAASARYLFYYILRGTE